MKSVLVAVLTSVSFLAIAPAGAADLMLDEPMASPGVVDVGGNWEGVYLGAFIGGASGAFTDANDGDWFGPGNAADISGWLVGVSLGANFYITDGVVGGIVGDVAWSDVSGDYEDATYTINWQGSVRGKLGFDAGALMPYVTAGVAFANGTFYHPMPGSDSQTQFGWTVGAGVEIAATEDLSIDLLYRYSDFGEKSYFDGTAGDMALDQHAVTVGLNWKF